MTEQEIIAVIDGGASIWKVAERTGMTWGQVMTLYKEGKGLDNCPQCGLLKPMDQPFCPGCLVRRQCQTVADDDTPMAQCPRCGEWIPDLDGVGVLTHEACGFCTHPHMEVIGDWWVCLACKNAVRPVEKTA